MRNLKRTVALFLWLAMAAPLALADATAIGNIEKATGRAVLIRSNGTEIEARAGLDLAPGDQVKTGKGGTLWFVINGTGQFRLAGESQMTIDELSETKSSDIGISLRMVLGFLTSKIKKISGSSNSSVVIHTPTATIGVRGTEFDTVAAIDGSSAVAVDDGLVEVETESGQLDLSPGKMSEVDAEGKSSAPAHASSRESRERDWELWRQQREEMMVKFLPSRIPKMKARFERWSDRFARFDSALSEASGRLRISMNEFKMAKAGGRGARLFRVRMSLRKDFVSYRLMTMQFRKGMNRIRIAAAHVQRIKDFVAENPGRFSAQDLEVIGTNLTAISAHSEQMVKNSRQNMQEIRQTFVEFFEMRKELSEEADNEKRPDDAEGGGFRRQGPFRRNLQNR